MKFKKYVILLTEAIKQAMLSPFYGFIQGHAHLSTKDIDYIESLLPNESSSIISEFEESFAEIVGNGQAISYASARMGFYVLMKVLGITSGDEILFTAATCSTMINAALRIGATPVYADIDPNTFGSNPYDIEKKITHKTKIIVAQHSFGIPCDITAIKKISVLKNIFLLEDCALTLGSRVNGITVGNFGDAALFSTDHSKPINTMLGGLIYTCNHLLYKKLFSYNSSCQKLSLDKKRAIWSQILLEKRLCNPRKYGSLELIDILRLFGRKISGTLSPFLDEDFSPIPLSSYPYPSKMPTFLAALGLIELKRWEQISANRIYFLKKFLKYLKRNNLIEIFPNCYNNSQIEIVPLRIAWSPPKGDLFRKSISHYIQTSRIWFLKPIVPTTIPLEKFHYKKGSCPLSEKFGLNMVNLPCNLNENEFNNLLTLFLKNIKPISG